MTLLVTKVGAPSTHTHNREDGSTFTKVTVPLTLSVKFGQEEGFTLGESYTLWLDPRRDASVIATAQALLDGTAKTKDGEPIHAACRLALENHRSDFECSAVRTNTFTDRLGVERSSKSSSIWLKTGCFAQWGIGEIQLTAETGNIHDLDILVDVKGMALLAAPSAPSTATSEDPF